MESSKKQTYFKAVVRPDSADSVSECLVSFVPVKAILVIELDGSQHLEQVEYDVERTRYFESQGYKVVRFWNGQVENDIAGVVRAIEGALDKE